MDLCDEADTTNDGKISIEEYLTIAKNYGIKVFYHWLLPVLILSSFFQLSSDDIGHVEDLANSNKELSKNDFIFHIKVLTVPFILTFPICCKERASDIFLASRTAADRQLNMWLCHSLSESLFWFWNTQRHPRHLRRLTRVMRKHDLANNKDNDNDKYI